MKIILGQRHRKFGLENLFFDSINESIWITRFTDFLQLFFSFGTCFENSCGIAVIAIAFPDDSELIKITEFPGSGGFLVAVNWMVNIPRVREYHFHYCH